MEVKITHIDTACVLLEIGGYKILTDPVFDPAGRMYHFGYGTLSRKTSTPAKSAAEIGPIDLVLLSHHQHQDNYDAAGAEFTKSVPLVLSTTSAAKSLTNCTGLKPWQSYSIETDKVPGLKITATPALHRPTWMPEFLSGKVVGFVIEYDGRQDCIYISGDTVMFDGVAEVGRRFNIGTAILHLGCVQFHYLTGPARYTMDAKQAVTAAKALNAKQVYPIHCEGWSHFKEKKGAAQKILTDEATGTQVVWLMPGQGTAIG